MSDIDILIRGGHVIDPARKIDRIADIAIKGNRIVDAKTEEPTRTGQVIDAAGCYVLPGLIDFHSHFFYGGSAISIDPDITFLPSGITTAVDAGTCGWSNVDIFQRSIIDRSRMRLFYYLNVSHAGQVTLGGDSGYPEKINGRHINGPEIIACCEKYRPSLIGLKLRFGKELYGEDDSPLRDTLRLAEQVGLAVCVHVPNCLITMDTLAGFLRPGDVFAHCYHDTGHTILDGDGNVLPDIFSAQRRGVYFDAAQGINLFSFRVARQAFAQHFYPDIISSDITRYSAWKPGIMFSLNFLMSKYIAMGMPLQEVVRAVTATPAGIIGQADKIGTLRNGACADVCIMKMKKQATTFFDKDGELLAGDGLLQNMLTICDGQVVFRQMDF
ncbi:metallo-dependent hydrolase [Martelella alba]|uniref:metallo-dependent hydrolase n=1 Tax=Martelella alba TaxID=2590451 RepID=UPI0014856366|nr:metallo-dependent hydrolase [Martelella alba]